METKQNNMNQPDDFPGIGKRLPYQTPDGYFDGLPEQTLEIARQRSYNRNSLKIVWRTIAVAASVAAVVLLVLIVPDRATIPQPVAENKSVEVEVPAVQEKPALEEPAPVVTEKVNEKPEQATGNETENPAQNEENVSDVLADLSDDELIQLASMMQADPFLEEAGNN